MGRRFFQMRSEGSRLARGAEPSLRQLQAALAALPPEWIVLRNRRIGTEDGPPWVRFIALHPAKGIALIDLQPKDPSAGIDPLDEFLARTGFGAFSAGDPPIVAVALGTEDIAETAARLDRAFAAVAPCGIRNANWPEAVADLLLTTPGLMLTRLPPPAEASVAKPPVASPADSVVPMKGATPRLSVIAPEAVPAAQILAQSEPEPVVHAAKNVAADPDEHQAPFEIGPGRFVWITASACAVGIVLGAVGLVYEDWQIGRPPPAVADIVPMNSPISNRDVAPADDATAPPVVTADATIPPRKPKHHVLSRPSRAVATRQRTRPADGPAHVFYAIGDWFASLR